MKLFRKLDEMELEIKHKGNMAGLIFLNISMIALIIKGMICNQDVDIFVELILGELLVVFFAKLVHRRNYGDEGWKKSLQYFVIGVIMFIVILLVLSSILEAVFYRIQPQV